MNIYTFWYKHLDAHVFRNRSMQIIDSIDAWGTHTNRMLRKHLSLNILQGQRVRAGADGGLRD